MLVITYLLFPSDRCLYRMTAELLTSFPGVTVNTDGADALMSMDVHYSASFVMSFFRHAHFSFCAFHCTLYSLPFIR